MTDFNEYKLIHNFVYPDISLKSWINKINFTNNYKDQWDVLMMSVEKIITMREYRFRIELTTMYDPHLGYNCMLIDNVNDIFFLGISLKSHVEATYNSVIDFIKWYNKNKSKWKIK